MSDMTTKQMTDYLSGDLEPFPWSIEFAIIARLREADQIEKSLALCWHDDYKVALEKVEALESENKRLGKRWERLREWTNNDDNREKMMLGFIFRDKMDSLEQEK